MIGEFPLLLINMFFNSFVYASMAWRDRFAVPTSLEDGRISSPALYSHAKHRRLSLGSTNDDTRANYGGNSNSYYKGLEHIAEPTLDKILPCRLNVFDAPSDALLNPHHSDHLTRGIKPRRCRRKYAGPAVLVIMIWCVTFSFAVQAISTPLDPLPHQN